MAIAQGFGAVGDGRTDDTEALRHAVEQCGGRLELTRGTYRITGTIEVDLDRFGPIAISGSGGTARIVMDAPGPAIRLVGTHAGSALPSSFEPRVWQRQRMPSVADLEIVGNHEAADGIALESSMQATLTGLLIRHCRFGIHLVKRNRNVLIANSHIFEGRGAAIGVYFDGVNLHQTIISGCHISYCAHAGIKIAHSEIRNLQITGCDIEYNHDVANPNSADIWIDAREGTVREVTIASNTIQAKGSPRGANIRIEGPPLDDSRAAGLWTICGNILQDQQVNLWLQSCRGVVASGNSFASAYTRSVVIDHCRHINLGSNIFDHNPDYTGDRVDGIQIHASKGVNLTGLILEDCRAGDADRGGAIEVRDSSEVLISGCQLLDVHHRAIDIEDTRNTTIRDCQIIQRGSENHLVEGVRVRSSALGRSQQIVVSDCLISPGSNGAVVVDPNAIVRVEGIDTPA